MLAVNNNPDSGLVGGALCDSFSKFSFLIRNAALRKRFSLRDLGRGGKIHLHHATFLFVHDHGLLMYYYAKYITGFNFKLSICVRHRFSLHISCYRPRAFFLFEFE